MLSGIRLIKLFTGNRSAITLLLLIITSAFQSKGQTLPTNTKGPRIDFAVHNSGNIQAVVSNLGRFGGVDELGKDPFTGEVIAGFIYPRNSDFFYGSLGLWVGARVGGEYLVSSGSFFDGKEFFPDVDPFGRITLTTINHDLPIFSSEARAEMDITAVYFDTLTDPRYVFPDWNTQRLHLPLGIRVTERSMSWSGENIDDFILLNFDVTNIGEKLLSDVYVGFMVDAEAVHSLTNPVRRCEQQMGFLKQFQDVSHCGIDTVNVAYWMDNDGDPSGNRWTESSPRSAAGLRVLGSPLDSLVLNYNWWTGVFVDDTSLNPFGNWGPRLQATPDDPFRKLGSGLGYPEGDASKYYVLSHDEFDYDQMFLANNHFFDGWLPPPNYRNELASGGCGEFVLSFGAGGLGPGSTLSFTIALVAGDSVHVNPTDYADLWNPQNPGAYYNSLDFSRLALNSRWASWVYDNPGVDTDGDGFFGKFRMCDGDTFWYEGDGVPDFRADVPPPSPEVTVIPSEAKLAVRWNGFFSETNVDPFTRTKDFEGYRVYLGLDDRSSSLSIISSFDNLNYNRFKLIKRPNGRFDWVNNDLPFTIDSLKILFNDQSFDPLNWTRTNPLTFNDTLFRFEKQDFNRSDLLSRNGIHKVFPNAIDPGPDTLLWNDSDLVFDHDRPLPKFYEYELVVDNLLPTVRQYVSVTAFDFGFSAGNIPAKESNKLNNITEAFARTDVDTVEAKNLDVYIYPNPYRIDGNLINRGFENRDGTQANQRAHRVHFVNLPKVCKITIYSLDGDRIDSFEHNFPQGGPEAMHDEWDMITRNGLIPVSGIYYWVVEAETRTQMGKLIIIK